MISTRILSSQGYAYVEFELKEVSQIAAHTLNKMLLWGRKLEVKVLSETHKDLFKNWNRKIHAVDRQNQRKARQQTNGRVQKAGKSNNCFQKNSTTWNYCN